MSLRSAMSILSAFSRPRAVVVVGASANPQKLGHVIMKNLVQNKFPGRVFAVNRKTPVGGSSTMAVNQAQIQLFSTVLELPPNSCDLAVVVTPASSVPQIIDDLGKVGIKAAIVISAGFKEELGAEGRLLESKMLANAQKHGVRILGPNTLGIIDTAGCLNASFAIATPLPGNVAMMSQSGAIVTALLDLAGSRDLGFSHFVSLGNKADLDETDWAQHWASNSRVQVICAYLEGIKRGVEFMRTTQSVTKLKPVIIIKAGRYAKVIL